MWFSERFCVTVALDDKLAVVARIECARFRTGEPKSHVVCEQGPVQGEVAANVWEMPLIEAAKANLLILDDKFADGLRQIRVIKTHPNQVGFKDLKIPARDIVVADIHNEAVAA